MSTENIEEIEMELEEAKILYGEFDSTISFIQKISNDVEYPQMIPFGRRAFFPGKLINTDEIFSGIGSDYFVKRSAEEAIIYLEKSQDVVSDQIILLEQDLKQIKEKEAKDVSKDKKSEQDPKTVSKDEKTEKDAKLANDSKKKTRNPQKGDVFQDYEGNYHITELEAESQIAEEDAEDFRNISQEEDEDLYAVELKRTLGSEVPSRGFVPDDVLSVEKKERSELLAKLAELEEMAEEDEEKAFQLLEEFKLKYKVTKENSSTPLRTEDAARATRLPSAAAVIPENLGRPVKYLTKEDLGQTEKQSTAETATAVPKRSPPAANTVSNTKSSSLSSSKDDGLLLQTQSAAKKQDHCLQGLRGAFKSTAPVVVKAPVSVSVMSGKREGVVVEKPKEETTKRLTLEEVLDSNEAAFSFNRPIVESEKPAGQLTGLAGEFAKRMFIQGGDQPANNKSEKTAKKEKHTGAKKKTIFKKNNLVARFGSALYSDSEELSVSGEEEIFEDEDNIFKGYKTVNSEDEDDDEESFDGLVERFALRTAPPPAAPQASPAVAVNTIKSTILETPVSAAPAPKEEAESSAPKMSLFKQRMLAKKGL